MIEKFKFFLKILICSFVCLHADKPFFYGVEFPWTAEHPANIDTCKQNKLELLNFLSVAASNASEKYGKNYKKAIPLFNTLKKLTDKYLLDIKKILKNGEIWDIKVSLIPALIF